MKLPKPDIQSNKKQQQRPLHKLGAVGLLLLIILVACSPKPETVTVEVTRVVTETVVIDGEEVEVVVTRVVTETVLEEVEIEPVEPDGDLPSATGSEGDAEPLPPPPDNGPKVAESRGSTQAAALVVETAVTLRANQTSQITNSTTVQSIATTTVTIISSTDLQKWCQLATQIYKKRCN